MILLAVFTALVKLGLGFPCSENRGEEGDKRLYRLAHDEARAARSAFRPGRLWGEGVFGEANTPSRLRGGTRIKTSRQRRKNYKNVGRVSRKRNPPIGLC